MRLGGVDANLLVSLHALLQERSVTRAARRVGLGQSSMSHSLARLRDLFSDELLVPMGRQLVLTARAKALVGPVERAVASLERVFLEEGSFDPANSDRTFRIASTDNIGLYLLPRLAHLLAREAPGVDLRVEPLGSDWIARLQNGEIDLKLGRRYRLPAGLRSQDLFDEQFICVVASKHPVSEKPSLEEFAALRHLAVTSTSVEQNGLGGYVDNVLARHGSQRRVAMTVPHFLVAPYIVAASDLALTASKRLLSPFVKTLRLRPIELPARFDTYRLSQVWSQRSDDDDGHAWLRGAVARAAAAS
jgi:DNA-binding transcriptional LysR family regulator